MTSKGLCSAVVHVLLRVLVIDPLLVCFLLRGTGLVTRMLLTAFRSRTLIIIIT